MSYNYDDYDDLMGELDQYDEEAGVDEYDDEQAKRLPYIGILQSRTDVPDHIKHGFSTAHLDESGNPFYEYISALKFMIILSLTSMHGRERVGSRRFTIPNDDESGTEHSVFPDIAQKGNGYNQACQSWNGIFPNPSFEGETLRDPRTGALYKIGWRGHEQLPPSMICSSCPFKEWGNSRARPLKGSNKPLCSPSWTWIIYVLPGQAGTNNDGEEIEIHSGLYRLTGNNTSTQTALFGVSALKRDGTPRWGALKNGEGIVGINSLTSSKGAIVASIPCSQTLTKRQSAKWNGDIIDAKGVLVAQPVADEHPDDHFYQISSPTTLQFPEGKPELVGDVPVYPLIAVTQKNNNMIQGKPSPVSVPVTSVGKEQLTGEEYMGYLRAWLEFVKVYKEDMLSLSTGDYLSAQEQTARWALESGELPALSDTVEGESEDVPFD